MVVTDDTETKFVIKHVFKDVKKLVIDGGEEAEIRGPVEKHCGVKWQLTVSKYDTKVQVYLDCHHDGNWRDWSIETECSARVGPHFFPTKKHFFPGDDFNFRCLEFRDFDKSFSSDSMPVEFHVTIKEMYEIEDKKLKHFDDDNAKEHSDVVLKVVDQKFYVNKMYLASHSSYFKSLFSTNFAESQESEIELKDIDPNGFQHFLELIHARSYVKENTVTGILKLADYFDAPSALERCEEFLMKEFEFLRFSLAEKFRMSIEYKLKNLRSKCLKEMKN